MKMNVRLVNLLFLVISLLSLFFLSQEVKYRLYNTTHRRTDTLTATTDTPQWSWKQGRPMSTAFLWAAGALLDLTRELLCPPWHSAVQVYLGSQTCSTQGNTAKAMLSTCRPWLFSAQSCCATLALKDVTYLLQGTNLHDKSWRSWPQKQD